MFPINLRAVHRCRHIYKEKGVYDKSIMYRKRVYEKSEKKCDEIYGQPLSDRIYKICQ